MTHGLHAVLTAVCQSGTIPPDWKRGLVVPIWEGKEDRQDCNSYRGITLLSVPGKVLAHLLLMRIRAQLLKLQAGFTPGKSTNDRILGVVHKSGGFRHKVLRRFVLAHGVMDSLNMSIWRCRYLCRKTKIRIFKSLVLNILLYGCETWTLNSDLKRRIYAFDNKCHRKIIGYRWFDFVSNRRLLSKTD